MIVSYLVLDYNKPEETELCLESISKYSKFDYKVVLLSNGGKQDYLYKLYEDNLIDKLILRKNNTGCGYGMDELFRSCDTEYAILMQNDQFLFRDLNQQQIDFMISKIKPVGEIGAISLAGLPGGPNVYSERAHIINVDFYLSIPRSMGGPGPFNFLEYSEQSVQDFFRENNIKFVATDPFVCDNGKTSCREIGDGIYIHTCDTKKLSVIKKPTYRTETYPPLNDEEWKIMLSGNWIDGTIPEEWKAHSFIVWDK